MKTLAAYPLFALIAFALFPFSFVNAANYSDNGTNTSYSLYNGDTLKVLSGTYNGSLNVFNTGSVVVVFAGATFKPNNINVPKGKIINYGLSKFTFSLGSFEEFGIANYGTMNFLQDVSLYSGTTLTQNWYNYAGAVINVTGSFNMGAKAKLINDGIFTVSRTLNMYEATTEITNNKNITVGGTFNMSGGILNNENRIITGDFNYWGGQLNNDGSLNPDGSFTISSGKTYVNNCRLITKGPITNYGTLQNSGLLWAGTTNTNADEFYNSGTFISASNHAKLRSVKLTNYGAIKGNGFLYFTGSTYSSGTVGVSETTSDTLQVDDVTRTNSPKIFDTQYGTVYNNTVYRSFSAPDSFEIYDGCSDIFKSSNSIILPVRWNYFYVKAVQDQPVLFWSAEYEPNMKFEIERSYNGMNFQLINTMYSNVSAAYSFTDRNNQSNSAYYRIKGTSAIDGAVKYTDIKAVNFGKSTATVSVYPNPVIDKVSINYTSDKLQQIIINIKSANGQTLMMKNVMANPGVNLFELNDVKSFQKGIYFVNLISGNSIVATEKIIKQ